MSRWILEGYVFRYEIHLEVRFQFGIDPLLKVYGKHHRRPQLVGPIRTVVILLVDPFRAILFVRPFRATPWVETFRAFIVTFVIAEDNSSRFEGEGKV